MENNGKNKSPRLYFSLAAAVALMAGLVYTFTGYATGLYMFLSAPAVAAVLLPFSFLSSPSAIAPQDCNERWCRQAIRQALNQPFRMSMSILVIMLLAQFLMIYFLQGEFPIHIQSARIMKSESRIFMHCVYTSILFLLPMFHLYANLLLVYLCANSSAPRLLQRLSFPIILRTALLYSIIPDLDRIDAQSMLAPEMLWLAIKFVWIVMALRLNADCERNGQGETTLSGIAHSALQACHQSEDGDIDMLMKLLAPQKHSRSLFYLLLCCFAGFCVLKYHDVKLLDKLPEWLTIPMILFVALFALWLCFLYLTLFINSPFKRDILIHLCLTPLSDGQLLTLLLMTPLRHFLRLMLVMLVVIVMNSVIFGTSLVLLLGAWLGGILLAVCIYFVFVPGYVFYMFYYQSKPMALIQYWGRFFVIELPQVIILILTQANVICVALYVFVHVVWMFRSLNYFFILKGRLKTLIISEESFNID